VLTDLATQHPGENGAAKHIVVQDCGRVTDDKECMALQEAVAGAVEIDFA